MQTGVLQVRNCGTKKTATWTKTSTLIGRIMLRRIPERVYRTTLRMSTLVPLVSVLGREREMLDENSDWRAVNASRVGRGCGRGRTRGRGVLAEAAPVKPM